MSESLSLFDLDDAALRPIVEAIAGAPLAHFSLVALSPVAGGVSGGDKQLATFWYETQTGESGEETVFAKRCVWESRSEAVHYRYLATQTPPIPTPRLFGSLLAPDRTEIIFLERIETTSFRRDSEAEWRDMLSLLAQFNACPISEEYAGHLIPFVQIGRFAENGWISGLTAFPAAEETEELLRGVGLSEAEIPALTGAALRLFARAAAQPRGLLHQDFMPDNFGRLRSGEMVVFDLHKNACGPRFADVAPYLAPPVEADVSTAFLKQKSPKSPETLRESLALHYLSEYARFGGDDVSLSVFQEERTALSLAHRVSVLPYLAKSGATDSVRRTLDELRSLADRA